MTASDLLNRFMLALTVWREARGESRRGKVLVASVIRNRVFDQRWPDSYAAVALQPKQFSCFNAGDPNATLFPKDEDLSWIESVEAARVAIEDDVLTYANHYHTAGIKPAWADASKIVDTEGRHIFYKL